MHYVHFYSVSCIHNHRSNFMAYTSLYLIQHKTDQLNDKYEKLRNCLFKMK